MKTLLLVALLAAPAAAADGSANSTPQPVSSANDPSKRDQKQAARPPERARLDVNSATKDELKSLPGFGETFAQRVIDNRPYKKLEELVERRVIPPSLFRQLKNRLTTDKARSAPVTTEPTR